MDDLWAAAKICRVANADDVLVPVSYFSGQSRHQKFIGLVREKLRNIARKHKAYFCLSWLNMASYNYLCLSRSAYRETFVWKGALLFELWRCQQYRPTRDADFLARGDNSPERFARIFSRALCDGSRTRWIALRSGQCQRRRIAEDAAYEGVRVSFTVYLERAKIPIQIDIGFGDAVTPPPIESNYPTLLESPAPRPSTYPRETVVAEKLEAMVKLGIANSRVKTSMTWRFCHGPFPLMGKGSWKPSKTRLRGAGTDSE